MSTKRILFVREDYDISGIANCFLKEEKNSLNGFALYFDFCCKFGKKMKDRGFKV